jgi:predicted transcriptional regulator
MRRSLAVTGQLNLLDLTTEIVASYAGNNAIAASELPNLIQRVHAALAGATTPAETAETPVPAVPIKKSVTPDYIICLEDGAKLKMLKRYIRTRYNLSPEEYRRKWGLPSDYPMTAPNYSATRSQLARDIGLGQKAPKRKGRRAAAARASTSKTRG